MRVGEYGRGCDYSAIKKREIKMFEMLKICMNISNVMFKYQNRAKMKSKNAHDRL